MTRSAFSVRALLAVLLTLVFASGCGGGDSDGPIRVISPDSAREILFDAPPEDLIVLDVRTPSEFNAGRLPEAQLLDFYRADFADRLAELPRDVPYLLYCRTGNRSGETRKLMEDLGFSDVSDIDGGFAEWHNQGHPFVIG